MKRFLVSILFVALGSGLWWILSTSHYGAVKKWDAKFDSAVRHSLTNLGFKDSNVVSAVNVIRRDDDGQWVTKKMTLAAVSESQLEQLRADLESTGATVSESQSEGMASLLVKRGNRIYQQISFPR